MVPASGAGEPWLLIARLVRDVFGPVSATRDLDGLDDHRIDGTVAAASGSGCDRIDDVAAVLVGHLAEDGVLHVEVWRRTDRNEELRAVRARPGVGHGKHVRLRELQLGVELVLELVAGSAHSAALGVTALDHESRDHPVKDQAIVETT